MKKNYYFVYKTTNLINGKYYIGVHSSRTLNDKYLGSGRELRKAIRKYGVENFKREILGFCETEEEAYLLESQKVTWKEVLDPQCYNIKLGGTGGSEGLVNMHTGTENIRVQKDQIEEYQKRGYSLGRSLDVVEKRKNMKYVYKDGVTTSVPKECVEAYLQDGWNLGRAYMKGSIQVWKDGKRKYIPSSELESFIEQGWQKQMPQDRTAKISLARKERGGTTTGRIRVRKEGQPDKLVSPEQVEQYVKDGWVLGRTSPGKGVRVWVSKEEKSLCIQKAELDKYLTNGWTLGRLNYVRKK